MPTVVEALSGKQEGNMYNKLNVLGIFEVLSEQISFLRGKAALHIIAAIENTEWFKREIYVRQANGYRIRKIKTMYNPSDPQYKQTPDTLDANGKRSAANVIP